VPLLLLPARFTSRS